MPNIQDYDPNDENEAGYGPGGSSGSSSGGGMLQNQSQGSNQTEQEYTPWSRFTSANSEVSDREAGKLKSQVGADVDASMRGINNANRNFQSQIAGNYAPPKGDNAINQDSQSQKKTATAANVFGNQDSFGGAAPGGAQPGAWSSFGQAAAQTPTSGAPGTQKAAGGITATPTPTAPGGPMSQLRQMPHVTDAARDAGPKGPKDLESSMSQDAWGKLVGNSVKASGEAGALGSEKGVQALLQQNSAQPSNSAFDAALINGSGGRGFQDTARQYGGNALPGELVRSEQASQDAWSKLGGDIGNAKNAQAAKANAQQVDADNARGVVDLTPKSGAPADGKPYVPSKEEQEAKDKTMADWGPRLGQFGSKDAAKDMLKQIDEGKTVPDLHMNFPDGTPMNPGYFLGQAKSQLDISSEQLSADFDKMTDKEYQEFMVLGVIPSWMDVGPKATGVSKGTLGGWNSPLAAIGRNYDPEQAAQGNGDAVYAGIGSLFNTFMTIAKIVL